MTPASARRALRQPGELKSLDPYTLNESTTQGISETFMKA